MAINEVVTNTGKAQISGFLAGVTAIPANYYIGWGNGYNQALTAGTAAGATSFSVASTTHLAAGNLVSIGPSGGGGDTEQLTVATITSATAFTTTTGAVNAHTTSDFVTAIPSASDTGLFAEDTTAGYARVAATRSQVTTSTTNDTARFTATINAPSTTAETISEVAIFDAATGGNCIYHRDFGGANVTVQSGGAVPSIAFTENIQI